MSEDQLKLFLDRVSDKLKEPQYSLSRAIEEVQTMSGSPKVAECVQRRHEERVRQTFELHEEGWIEEGGFSPWYFDGDGGPYWLALKAILEEQGWDDDAINDLDSSSQGVVSRLANPTGPNDGRYGLVVGYVQSGKTTNFTSVIAKSADAGYRLFIVLSGMSNALREQTQARLQLQLVDPNEDSWYRLTEPDETTNGVTFTGDFSGDKNPSVVLGPKAKALKSLAVVKKNGARLRALRDWIAATPRTVLASCPVLIVDDEADQASINVSRSEDKPTAINGLIREIIGMLPKVTYVGYTATPFANVLIDPKQDDNLYPRDFIHSLKKPAGHFGPESLHGREPLDRDATGDDPDGDGLDMVRQVPTEELDGLRHVGRDLDGFAPVVTPSLRSATRYFWLATAARRARAGRKQHSSMLVHTSMRVQIHHQFKELLERERVETLEKLRRRDESLESDLRDFWDAEIEKVDASSDEWDHRQISYVELRGWLDEVLVDSRVIEENATSVDRLNYGEDPETVVVVGGNTVARGLTLEGLVSSFFVRSAGAYDTLLQMGRWFGFRNGYEDLPRIWMTDELNDWFHHLATVEQEIRYDIGRYEAEGLSPLQFGPRLRTHPAIAITAAAKMRDATDAQVSFSGRRIQTILFDHRSKVWLEGNLRAARNLVSASLDYGIEPEDMKNGNWVFRDVRAAAVLDFLRDYQFHKAARELDNARLTSYVRSQLKNRELERWSIVIAGLAGRDDHLDDIELGLPRRINMINRSRMPSSPEYANIKALMSKVDRMLDFGWKEDQIAGVGAGKLASLRNSPEPDSSGRQPGYGDDSGLLVLYPISRHSKAKPGSKRKDLEAVDDVIGVGMVFPEAMTDDGKQDYKTADLSSQVPEELTEDDVLVEDVAPIPKFNS